VTIGGGVIPPAGDPGDLSRPDRPPQELLQSRLHLRGRCRPSCAAQLPLGWRATSDHSVAEQLGLGGSELVVSQRALLVQGVELVQLVEQ
jgi:hypothetical protein